MELAMNTLLTYVPLAVAGFALMMALISSWLFSVSFSDEKLTRPIEAWMIPALST